MAFWTRVYHTLPLSVWLRRRPTSPALLSRIPSHSRLPSPSPPLTTAVLIALQTHLRFERDKKGQWALHVEKRPTKDALLKPLVEKLLGFISKAGG